MEQAVAICQIPTDHLEFQEITKFTYIDRHTRHHIHPTLVGIYWVRTSDWFWTVPFWISVH